eukprot:TRINITY_DN11408_c0_g2_i2.p1 TRINITY_DN11408_c0_g2~~TRINITY_DN11408_c0_g2_i2.p1  ORF type:complete len:296 (+),score=64.73 TRINITY_DN11408_c0_g2_i2:89-976(+)
MADDELIVPIEKALWPRGVVRGLTPVLRDLGDKNGNIVIVAQPTKGHIMLKGPPDRIEAAKPGLIKIIEEHFPDADTPEELLAAGPPQAVPEVAPTPAPVAETAAAAAPAAPAKSSGWFGGGSKKPAAPAKATAAVSNGPIHPRNRPDSYLGASPDLIWQCIRKNSCFKRGPMIGGAGRCFSAEPVNLLGVHTQQFSSLASCEALDVRPLKRGDKESIELVHTNSKAGSQSCPGRRLHTSGLHKCRTRGLKRLEKEIIGRTFRPGLFGLAREKYLKVSRSFKKRRQEVRSRRANK